MDILTVALATISFLHFKDAKGVPMFDENKEKVGVNLFGPGTPEWAIMEDRQIARLNSRKDDDPRYLAREQREKINAGDLADITAGFVGFTYPPAGEKQGRELFEAVYLNRRLGFLTKQVTDHLAEVGNWSPA